MLYTKIYNNICDNGKLNKQIYENKKSDLHKHHIIPTHSGGHDIEENYTYISVREHIICHFLLWKINKLPNDLRAMKMLGAKLTKEQRKIVGIWCKNNKIGYHADDVRKRVGKQTYEKQKKEYENSGDKNFYYWSTDEGRNERASMGGKASWEKTKNERGLPYFVASDPIQRKENAKKAGAASPKKPVTDGKTTIKFFTEEERLDFIKNNPSFRIGAHYLSVKRNRGKKKV